MASGGRRSGHRRVGYTGNAMSFCRLSRALTFSWKLRSRGAGGAATRWALVAGPLEACVPGRGHLRGIPPLDHE